MIDEIIASFIVLGSLEETSRESQQKVIIIIMMYAASSFVIITPSSIKKIGRGNVLIPLVTLRAIATLCQ